MLARGSPLYWNLLVMGAYSGLPARCMAVAFQIRSDDHTADKPYVSMMSFTVGGIDYDSLVVLNGLEYFRSYVASALTSSISYIYGYPPGCDSLQVTLSHVSSGSVAGESSIACSTLDYAEGFTETVRSHDSHILAELVADINLDSTITSIHGEATNAVATSISTKIETNASAIGDPHLATVTGSKFDVNVPGSYVLVRAPEDRRLPAKLELNATIRPSAGAPCGLYVKSIELGGEWLGGQVVSVVPLQRDVEGQNGAGSQTLRPFSVRVGAPRGAPSTAPGEYEQWGHLGKEGRSLSGRVRLAPAWRQVYADAGRPQEAQAFRFSIRGDRAGRGATLEAAQAAHQALDFSAEGLRSLGFEQLGGLLGTEGHDKQIEQIADECKAFRARTRQGPSGLSMAASWDASL